MLFRSAVSCLCRPLCGPVGKDLPDEKQSIYISMFHDLMENLTLNLCALHVQTAAALPHAGIVRLLLLHCFTQALFDCCCTASRKHCSTAAAALLHAGIRRLCLREMTCPKKCVETLRVSRAADPQQSVKGMPRVSQAFI